MYPPPWHQDAGSMWVTQMIRERFELGFLDFVHVDLQTWGMV